MLNVKHKIDIAKFKEHVKNAFEGVGIYEDTKSMIEYVNTGFQEQLRVRSPFGGEPLKQIEEIYGGTTYCDGQGCLWYKNLNELKESKRTKTLLLTEQELYKVISILIENKIPYLTKRYRDKMVNQYGRYRDMFNDVLDADPTTDKIYSEWIFQKLDKNIITPNDLPKLKEYLTTFKHPKVQNKISNKNLYSYKTLDALADEVLKYAADIEAGEYDTRKETYENTYVGKAGKYKIYRPKTHNQACHLSKGAQWCTGIEGDEGSESTFLENTENDDLFIFISGDEKYQWGAYSGRFHNKENFETYMPKEIFDWLVKNNLKTPTVREKIIYKIPLTDKERYIPGDLDLRNTEVDELPMLYIGGNLYYKNTPLAKKYSYGEIESMVVIKGEVYDY